MLLTARRRLCVLLCSVRNIWHAYASPVPMQTSCYQHALCTKLAHELCQQECLDQAPASPKQHMVHLYKKASPASKKCSPLEQRECTERDPIWGPDFDPPNMHTKTYKGPHWVPGSGAIFLPYYVVRRTAAGRMQHPACVRGGSAHMSPLAHTPLSRPMRPPKKSTPNTLTPPPLNYCHNQIQSRLEHFSQKHFKQNNSKSESHKTNALNHYSITRDSM